MSISKKTIKRLEREVEEQFGPEGIICVQDYETKKYYYNDKEYDSLEEMRTHNNLSSKDKINVEVLNHILIERYFK